jgi:hypothetical protein
MRAFGSRGRGRWSLVRRDLLSGRERRSDGRPLSWCALDLEYSAEGFDPLPEIVEAHAPSRHLDVEALSVVIDLEEEAGISSTERDAACGGGPVPADVGEGLARQLHHVCGSRGERRRGLGVDVDDRHDTGT